MKEDMAMNWGDTKTRTIMW